MSGHEESKSAESLHISLLGVFHIEVGAQPIAESEWRRRKACRLVKLLALAPAHRLHREQVIEWLWPDLDPEAAINNLHHTLYTARRVLSPQLAAQQPSPYLSFQDEILILSASAPVWTDVEAFETACDAAQQTRQLADYEAALTLYGGELLPEDRYEDWTVSRREQLRQRYLTLLSAIARLRGKRQEYAAAIAALQQLIAAEPVQEEAHEELMRLYTTTGQNYQALRQYQQLRDILRRELDIQPTTATQQLYDEIRAVRYSPPTSDNSSSASQPLATALVVETIPPVQAALAPTAPRTNLPHAVSSFVGRAQEMAAVSRLLATTRLLTLTGAGGCGKTRLALQAAALLQDRYPDGVFLVSLASLTGPSLVPQAVAEALELDLRAAAPAPPIEMLQNSLREKQLLLLLDNCEHLHAACVQLVETLLRACPRLHILATSRQRLGVIDETSWLVPSLAFPDPEQLPPFAQLLTYDAVRLFHERATASRSSFVLTTANAPAVVMICQRLDGIPLALELAAARVKALAAEQIAARLDDALALLVTGNSSAPPRQQTLRAALDWSYALLSETEQALFRRVSVFAGGWTIEAAEGVCADDGVERAAVLDLLAELTDKSLVLIEDRGDHMRYRLLEMLRQYSAAQLTAADEAQSVKRRHAAWYLALVERVKSQIEGAGQEQLIKQLEEEHDNARAALQWALEHDEGEIALRLGGALWRFWQVRGYLNEGRTWLQKALTKAPDGTPAARAAALQGAGVLAMDQGDYAQALTLYEESLALYRSVDDKNGVIQVLNNLGIIAEASGDYTRATLLYEESLALARAQGNKDALARALNNLGVTVYRQGDYARAFALYDESLALVRTLGNQASVVIALNNLGEAACRNGDYTLAESRYREGLPLAQSLGYKTALAFYLEGLAVAAWGQGQLARAARLWGAAEALRAAINAPLEPDDRPRYDELVAAARAQTGAEEFARLWAEGRALPLDQTIAYALTVEQPAPLAAKTPDRAALSQREGQIVALIATGCTNREIAAALAISQRTVDTHISNILSKLGFTSRTQIAEWLRKLE